MPSQLPFMTERKRLRAGTGRKHGDRRPSARFVEGAPRSRDGARLPSFGPGALLLDQGHFTPISWAGRRSPLGGSLTSWPPHQRLKNSEAGARKPGVQLPGPPRSVPPPPPSPAHEDPQQIVTAPDDSVLIRTDDTGKDNSYDALISRLRPGRASAGKGGRLAHRGGGPAGAPAGPRPSALTDMQDEGRMRLLRGPAGEDETRLLLSAWQPRGPSLGVSWRQEGPPWAGPPPEPVLEHNPRGAAKAVSPKLCHSRPQG